MDNYEQKRDMEEGSEEVYSKAVRAGRRTYFFDVKSTRGDDYYLTITESRKKIGKDGNSSYEKHKIYLYKEDFAKFGGGLSEVIDFIKERKPEFFEMEKQRLEAKSIDEEFDKL